MVLEVIAIIVLAGMLTIPLINIVVGLVGGALLGGAPGALVGLARHPHHGRSEVCGRPAWLVRVRPGTPMD